MELHSVFGVCNEETERFVEDNEIVKSFLSKYSLAKGRGQNSSRANYAQILCRFFKWLRVVKGWDVSPRELLNDQLRRRESKDVEERRFHANLVLEFTRDNPVFKEFSDGRKYQYFVTIKSFYDYHEVPLTTAKGKFGKRKKRKNHPSQISLSEAKKILGVLGQRERTILLIMLQSGMEIGAVLYKFGYMWASIKPQLEDGRERIKIEIDERKGNGRWYFTYISRDAIQELKKWLALRKKIIQGIRGKVNEGILAGNPIFITNRATPYGEDNFYHNYNYTMRKHKLKKMPYEKVTHMFRKLFKTEASIPERGIDRNIIEFFMGHTNGIEVVGGEYDRIPEIHEDVLEKEYSKIEPFINIYSSSVAKRQTDPLLQDIEQLNRLPGMREVFSGIVKDAKARLAEKLELQKTE